MGKLIDVLFFIYEETLYTYSYIFMYVSHLCMCTRMIVSHTSTAMTQSWIYVSIKFLGFDTHWH